MRNVNVGSRFNQVFPIVIGLLLAGIIGFGYPYPDQLQSVFWQNTILAGVLFVALVGCAIFIRSPRLDPQEIELWKDFRKTGRRKFILNETFSNYLAYVACLAIGGVLVLTDYIRSSPTIENLVFYLLPVLIVLSVQFITALRTWSLFEREFLDLEKREAHPVR